MGAALGDDELLDGSAAGEAGIVLAAVDAELVLVAAGLALGRAVEAVEARAFARDRFPQGAADLAVRPAKQPLRDAAALVRDRLGKDESILVIGLAHRVIDVYLADLDPQYSLMHGADLEHRLTADPEWIVLYYPNSVSQTNHALLKARGYEPIERFRGWADWGNGDVIVLKKRDQV